MKEASLKAGFLICTWIHRSLRSFKKLTNIIELRKKSGRRPTLRAIGTIELARILRD